MATITNDEPIEFAIGDYCEYRGERFELNYIPSKEKVASKNYYGEAFKYDSVKFNFLGNELVNCSFLDYVPSGNSLHYNGLSTFTFTGTVNNLSDRIKANLDRLYTGDKAWTITVAPNVESKTINVNASNINCFEALSLAKSDFDINFIIRNRTITIGAVGIDAGRTFGYGKGNGLISLKQTVNNDSKIITRLRAFGSTKNIPSRWYNKQINPSTGLPYIPESMYVPSLMLPSFLTNGGDAYVEDSLLNQTSYDGGTAASNNVIYTFDGGNVSVSPNITLDGGNAYSGMSYVDLYGVREGTVHFDGTGDNEEIYPSIEGITADQLAGLGVTVTLNTGDNGKLDEVYSATNPTDNGIIPTDGTKLDSTFFVELKDLGFDLSEKLSDGSYEYASTDGEITLSLTSGNCAARDFVVADNGITKVNTGGIITYKLELKRDEDTDIGMAFPNSTYPILSGDSFVLINIQMPDVWVNIASQKLYNKALEYLSVNNKPKYSYELNIDNIFMANNPIIGYNLKEGDTITFEDLDLPVSNKVIISSLEVKEGESLIPQYSVTLSNDITVSTIQQILNGINDTQVVIEQTKKDILKYTGRSFADIKETADALALAFNNYSDGITPAYINTLSLIAGTESQQFRFVNAMSNNPTIINYGFIWNQTLGTLSSNGDKYLQHLTLGISSLTPSSYIRDYTEYKFWNLLDTTFTPNNNNLKYIYAKCNKTNLSASYDISEIPYDWDADGTYYYFLIGVLNSVKDGSRSYTEVYGYTEILPSRITTEKVISSNGYNYFDLGANKFHLGTGDDSAYLDWNNKIANGLKIKGVIAQSQSGDESPIGVYRGIFNSSYIYYVGDLVTYNGSTYVCILNTTAGALPTDISYWKVYASSGSIGPAMSYTGNWVNGNTYYGSPIMVNVAYYNSVYYMTKHDISGGSFVSSSSPDIDTAHWNPFGSSFESVATGLLLAQSAYIENLIVSQLATSSNPNSPRFANIGNGIGIFKNLSYQSDISNAMIAMGKDISSMHALGEKKPAFVVKDNHWRYEYSSSNVYYKDDRVFYNDSGTIKTYIFIYEWLSSETPVPNILPTNTTYWSLLGIGNMGGGGYSEIGSEGLFCNGSNITGFSATTGIQTNCSGVYLLNKTISESLNNYKNISSALLGIDQSYKDGITVWNNSASYTIGKVVYYNSNSKYYECILDNINIIPTNTSYWKEYISSSTYGGYYDRLRVNGLYNNVRIVNNSGLIYKKDTRIHYYGSSDITLTIPICTLQDIGFTFSIRKLGAGNIIVIITTSSNNLIWSDGIKTEYVVDYSYLAEFCFDGNYFVVNKYGI